MIIEQEGSLENPVPWEFFSNGLNIHTYYDNKNYYAGKTFKVNGRDVLLPNGAIIAEVGFGPDWLIKCDPARRTFALSEWVLGLGEFFPQLERRFAQRPDLLPEYMVGYTNPRMGSFIQNMGIEISDIPYNKENYFFIGDLKLVRNLYNTKAGKINFSKMIDRAAREEKRSKLRDPAVIKQFQSPIIGCHLADNSDPYNRS